MHFFSVCMSVKTVCDILLFCFVGNILMVAAILFCGGTFEKMSNLASFLRLVFFSKTLFYRLQRMFVLPVIRSAWFAERLRVKSVLSGKIYEGTTSLI